MIARTLAWALIAVLAVASAQAQAQAHVYRWVDDKGRVHYGEQPPPGRQARAVENRLQTYTGPAVVSTVAAPRTSASRSVTMYTTQWCGSCRLAKAYLAKRGTPYVERDVEASREARAEFDRLGGRGVPVILVGEARMDGFDPAAFERMLQAAGL